MLATQNPIESEGTYPLPEAQVDRFLFKLLVDYPTVGEEAAVVGRVVAGMPEPRRVLDADRLVALRADRARGLRRPRRDRLRRRAGRRHPPPGSTTGWTSSRASSSTAPARAARSAWSRPARRSRCCAAATTWSPTDVADLAPDVLRHRLVLTYDALGDGVRPDDLVARVLAAVDPHEAEGLPREAAAA